MACAARASFRQRSPRASGTPRSRRARARSRDAESPTRRAVAASVVADGSPRGGRGKGLRESGIERRRRHRELPLEPCDREHGVAGRTQRRRDDRWRRSDRSATRGPERAPERRLRFDVQEDDARQVRCDGVLGERLHEYGRRRDGAPAVADADVTVDADGDLQRQVGVGLVLIGRPGVRRPEIAERDPAAPGHGAPPVTSGIGRDRGTRLIRRRRARHVPHGRGGAGRQNSWPLPEASSLPCVDQIREWPEIRPPSAIGDTASTSSHSLAGAARWKCTFREPPRYRARSRPSRRRRPTRWPGGSADRSGSSRRRAMRRASQRAVSSLADRRDRSRPR